MGGHKAIYFPCILRWKNCKHLTALVATGMCIPGKGSQVFQRFEHQDDLQTRP